MKSHKSQVTSRKSGYTSTLGVCVFITLISLFISPSCKKDEVIPTVTNDTIFDHSLLVSDTPKIAFVSISPAVVQEYHDSIKIVFSYVDGGGDLGDANTAVSNLFVEDSRNGIVYKYRIPQLSPDLVDVNVQGQFSVVISNTVITDGSSLQKLHYIVYIQDRAGHTSNSVETTEIEVIP